MTIRPHVCTGGLVQAGDAPVHYPVSPDAADLWQRITYTLWRCHEGTITLGEGRARQILRSSEIGLTEPGTGASLAPRTRAVRLVFDIVDRPRIWDTDGRLHITDESPQPDWRTIFGANPPRHIADDGVTAALIDDLSNRCYPDDQAVLRAQARLCDWLADQLAEAPPRTTGNLVERAEALIEHHLRDGITIGLVAERLGVARQTLTRHFESERGHGANEALHRIRLARAQRCLGMPGKRCIARAMEVCGFTDASAFGRWFRKRTGMSPRTWRLQQLGARG